MQADVAIVGSGFAGAALAMNLARENSALRVLLFDRDGGGGRGVAYGTTCMRHLLNVPAAKMSAFAAESHHFLKWLQRCHDPTVDGSAFAPRHLYGTYVSQLLNEAAQKAAITHRYAQVVRVVRDGDDYLLSDNQSNAFRARAVVLALGNFPPASLTVIGEKARYIESPWKANALDQVGQNETVLLVGTGLTSIDVLLSLEERGLRSEIHLVSRRGLLPLPHRQFQPTPNAFADDQLPTNIRALTNLVRKTAANAADWRAVVDALRPHTQSLWKRFSAIERRRFLRHLRPYWEVHRHRVAPEVLEVVDRMRGRGQLSLHKARIGAITAEDVALRIDLLGRGRTKTLRVGYVINCTGPQTNYRRISDPLIANLLQRGMIRPDPLGLGIETDDAGGVLAADGSSQPGLFTIGSPRKPQLWETTAVPELRVQAQTLARHLQTILLRKNSR